MNKRQKKIIRIAGSFLAVYCFTYPAGERLGETFTECETRYGKAAKIVHEGEKHARCYTKGDYRIDVVFWKDKVAEISYRKPEGGLLSSDELRLFLKVNAADSKWIKRDQVAEWKQTHKGKRNDPTLQAALMEDLAAFYLWRRIDEIAEASYDRETGILLLSEATYLDQLAQRRKKKKQDVIVKNSLGF